MAKAFAKPDHTQDHGQHFSCHGDSHQQERRKALEGGIDEELAYGAAGGEAQNVVEDGGMTRKEGNCGGEFVGLGRLEEGRDECQGDIGSRDKVSEHEYQAQKIEDDHHLRTRGLAIAVGRSKYVVLDGIGQPIKKEVDGEEDQSVRAAGLRGLSGGRVGLG